MTESVIANEMIELGKFLEARDALLRVIRLRFPEVLRPDLERAITEQHSYQVMTVWLDAAFDSKTAGQLLAVLGRLPPP